MYRYKGSGGGSKSNYIRAPFFYIICRFQLNQEPAVFVVVVVVDPSDFVVKCETDGCACVWNKMHRRTQSAVC